MIKEFKIPSPGESISEVEIAQWMVNDGAYVEKNDELAEVESDKATLLLVAEESGVISIKAKVGERVAVGSLAYTLDTDAVKPEGAAKESIQSKPEPVEVEVAKTPENQKQAEPAQDHDSVKVTPVAAEMMKANQLSVDDIINGLRRIGKHDVEAVLQNKNIAEPAPFASNDFSRNEDHQSMSMLRQKLSERLVKVKNETAMLTTFNEVDMSALIELRQNLQNRFVEKHGFKLGYMGFFTKAVSIAALHFPMVNARLEAEEIVSHQFVDVGIAVQSPKGLMVPIVRNAESKSVVQIE
ncbi:MAG: 2-oxo acid dehydrogenase subunit E2, partial [Prolixibacteraceae bacterium]|nr:2-oxo acid dehydrogenase subunit E2 [Prolixibacteraceae bacterium]